MTSDFLTFAHMLADAAAGSTLLHFGSALDVETKGDNSPVSIADREAEAAMRALIQQHLPEHGIFGEEFGIELVQARDAGKANAQPAYTWVIDPIDGTRAYIAGSTEWGTLIALCENGIPILGILDQPVTGERWVGVAGQPTTLNGQPIRTRACASLADAELSTTSANYFTPEQAKRVVALAQSVRATVKDGDCYAYGLLARGVRDLVLDAGLKPYDILALVPIIEGAGGKISDWMGGAVTLDNFSNVLAAGDATTHEAARKLLA